MLVSSSDSRTRSMSSSLSSARRTSISKLCDCIVRSSAECDDEFASPALARSYPRGAPMTFGYLAHDGKSGSGTFDLASYRAKEQLENALAELRRDAGAAI